MADENIDIEVSLRDEASRPADRVVKNIKEIDRSALKASTAVKLLEQRIKEEAREARQAALANERLAKSEKKVGDEAATAGAKAGKGGNGFKKMKKDMEGAGKAGSSLFNILKYGFMAGGALDAVGQLAGMLNAVGAGAIAAVNGLAPLSGMLVAYPAMFAAIGQGFAVTKMAFSGLGEAFKEMSNPDADPEKLAAAMKGVTKEGKSFLTYLVGLRKDFKGLQQDAQKGMLPGVEDAVRNLVTQGMPTLRKMVKDTSKDLGAAARGFSFTFGTTGNMKALGRIFKTNGDILRDFGRTAGHAFGIFIKVLDAARPMMRAMTKDIANFFSKMDNGWDAKKTKGLTNFFNDSYKLLKRVVKVGTDFSVGLINITKQSSSMSKIMGRDIEGIAKKFREWTGDKKNQAKMQDFFKRMTPIFRTMAGIVWDLGKALFKLGMDPSLVKNLDTLRTKTLPTLVDLTKQAQGKFIPAILDIIDNLGKIAAHADAFTPLSTALQLAADILLVVTGLFDKLPGSVSSAIITFGLFTLAARKLDIQNKITTGIIAPLGRVGPAASKASGQVGAAFASGGFRGAASKIGGMTASIGSRVGGGLLGALGGPWGVAFSIAGGVLATWMQKQADAKQAADDFRNALDQQTGAVNDNAKAIMGAQLQKDGMFKKAGEVGIDKGLLINAASGDQKALATMKKNFTDAQSAYDTLVKQTREAQKGLKPMDPEYMALDKQLADMQGYLNKTRDVTNSVGALGTTSQESIAKTKELAGALAEAGKKSDSTGKKVDDLAGKYVKLPPSKKTNISAPGVDTSKTKMDNFHRSVSGVPNSKTVHVGITGVEAAIAQTAALQRQINSLKGKTVGIHYAVGGKSAGGGTNTGGGVTAQADGGWSKPGMLAQVNERGPEAFWDRATGMLTPLGTGTPYEHVMHDRHGYVVPHEVLTGAKSGAGIPAQVMDAVKRSMPSAGGSGDASDMLPPVHVSVGSVRDDNDLTKIAGAVRSGIRQAKQEEKERR